MLQVAAVAFSCLAYVNSCVNPFIYNHASKDFRDAFLEVARCGRSPATGAATDGNNGRTSATVVRVSGSAPLNTIINKASVKTGGAGVRATSEELLVGGASSAAGLLTLNSMASADSRPLSAAAAASKSSNNSLEK